MGEKISVLTFVSMYSKTVSGNRYAKQRMEIFIPIMLALQKLVIQSEMEDTNETAHGEKGDADGDASVIEDNPSEEKEQFLRIFHLFLVFLSILLYFLLYLEIPCILHSYFSLFDRIH